MKGIDPIFFSFFSPPIEFGSFLGHWSPVNVIGHFSTKYLNYMIHIKIIFFFLFFFFSGGRNPQDLRKKGF